MALTFVPLLGGISLLFLPPAGWVASAAEPQAQSPPREGVEPERLVFLLQYLGSDYPAAVEAGQVVSPFEYQEMLDFSALVLEESQRLGLAAEELERLRELILARGDAAEVLELSRRVAARVSRELGVVSSPRLAPDPGRGRVLYRENCSRCHGQNGDGRGPSAAGLDPPPRSFRDERMLDLPPYQIYNAITFGVAGTEMPSHLESIDEQGRWDTAFHVMTLRSGFSPRRQPAAAAGLSLRRLATHSSNGLVETGRFERADVDFHLLHPPGPSPADLLERAGLKLQRSRQAHREGRSEQAYRLAVSAYLEGVEPVEPALAGAGDVGLRLEEKFAAYRAALQTGSGRGVDSAYGELRRVSAEARSALAAEPAPFGMTTFHSATIILREGVEAALLLGLILAYLATMGYPQLRRHVLWGAAAGVAAGLLSWWLAQAALAISRLQQEAIEGITSLLAALVLFCVSFWVIQQADVLHWKSYIRQRAERAVRSGKGWLLAATAFLVVYREAVETVLFYQALLARSGTAAPVMAGLLAGSLLLLLLIVLMLRFGVRLPLRQFFALTGVLLGLLAVSFAGYGVRELQAIAWIKETPLEWMVAVPLLEIRPTLEGCALQVGLLLTFTLGWFQMGRSRLRPAA